MFFESTLSGALKHFQLYFYDD
eukprot:UN10567